MLKKTTTSDLMRSFKLERDPKLIRIAANTFQFEGREKIDAVFTFSGTMFGLQTIVAGKKVGYLIDDPIKFSENPINNDALNLAPDSPHCYKAYYKTKELAKEALDGFRGKVGVDLPTRYYHCGFCGMYHLTKKKKEGLAHRITP